MLRTFFSGKRLKIILHLSVWALLFILPTYLLYGSSEGDTRFIREVWFQFAAYAAIFYLSYLFLVPVFFFRGRKAVFFLASAALILLLTFTLGIFHSKPGARLREDPASVLTPRRFQQGGIDRPGEFRPPGNRPPKPSKNWPMVNFFLMSCMVSGLSLGVRFYEKMADHERLRREAEQQKLRAELAFLKHQVNPHFLFNTLNSIYSLALSKSDLTAEAVAKLSDIMRYVIVETEREDVPLEQELEYMQHYVELQKLRLSEKVVVSMIVEGDPKPYRVPPMILVPFIENAFKHGTSSHEEAQIGIRLRLTENHLRFEVSNRVFPGREGMETFGVGLRNITKRLELIYPGRHTLELANDGSHFVSKLEIRLA